MPTVSVVRSTEEMAEFEIPSGEVLFDSLDNLGETLPHGCLAGSCGSCRILVIEGKENLSPPSAIEQDTINHIRISYGEKFGEAYLQGKTIRLSCRARVQGNVKIEKL